VISAQISNLRQQTYTKSSKNAPTTFGHFSSFLKNAGMQEEKTKKKQKKNWISIATEDAEGGLCGACHPAAYDLRPLPAEPQVAARRRRPS
jgi:hypothetical protein